MSFCEYIRSYHDPKLLTEVYIFQAIACPLTHCASPFDKRASRYLRLRLGSELADHHYVGRSLIVYRLRALFDHAEWWRLVKKC